jgi:lipopolysaccharide/colanic/teichoic acid biosynthesis glycosyltransferase
MRIILLITNTILISLAFVLAFIVRTSGNIPQPNLLPYKNSFVFLILIYISSLFLFGVYKTRFRSSWDLFKRIFSGLFVGTLLSVAFVYVFREKWGAFPTTVFIASFLVNLILIFKFNQLVLRLWGRIKKKIVVIGKGGIEDVTIGKAVIERIKIDEIGDLVNYIDIDEIIICDMPNEKDMGFIIYLAQRLKVDVIFSPVCYMKLLPGKINGNNSIHSLATFISRKREAEEFAIRSLDIIGSMVILFVSLPVTILTAILIKLTSKGSVIYKQQRVGKDGKTFILYKFRTMVNDAEKLSGFLPAAVNDPRITKTGRFLRSTRLDELPQLINVLKSQMSLVGPRPENLYRVGTHKALQELRLAVKPGLTGLAQIRNAKNAYDLHPKHKIKYDYLYIQRRSLFLNLNILAKTIPVMLFKKGQ